MLSGLVTVAFFILVWAAGTLSQYLYWQRVRKLIHEYAKDHVGYLGTGMCKVSFSKRAFILVLTDQDGIINGCFQLAGLSLAPRFKEMPGMLGIRIGDVMDHLANSKYQDAFKQAIHAIESSV